MLAMSIVDARLRTAEHALRAASAAAAKHYDRTLDTAAKLAQRRIRRRMPRAKSRDLSGNRTAGLMRKSVHIKHTGFGWHAERKIHAGGLAHVLIPGAPAREIHTKTAHALSMPPTFTTSRRVAGAVAFSSVHHPAVPAHHYVEEGFAEVMPEISALLAATGATIASELVRQIEGR